MSPRDTREPPAWLFVHGGFCDRTDWRAQVDDLQRDFRVASFDLPGHGQATEAGMSDIASLARWVNGLRARDPARSTLLVGHSLGCRVVLESHRQSPRSTAGIVLIEGDRLASSSAEPVIAALRKQAAAGGMQEMLRASFEAGLGTRVDASTRQHVLMRLRHIDAQFALELICNTAMWDCSEAASALGAVQVPLLAIQSTYIGADGTRRSLEDVAQSAWLAFVRQNCRQARVEVMHGAGHFPMLDSASHLNETLRRFVAALEDVR